MSAFLPALVLFRTALQLRLVPTPRSGSGKDTRGTAFVVYDDIYDAKNAVDHLSGFNVANRYLIVLYYNTSKQTKKVVIHAVPAVSCWQSGTQLLMYVLAQTSTKDQEAELRRMQEKYGVDGEQHAKAKK